MGETSPTTSSPSSLPPSIRKAPKLTLHQAVAKCWDSGGDYEIGLLKFLKRIVYILYGLNFLGASLPSSCLSLPSFRRNFARILITYFYLHARDVVDPSGIL